ncbi:AIG2 family protein [Sphingobium herbicidovorans NBRC 16415]|uniref:AIG2 family protein n=1 Tax=Sphingobium herbicidovorans (strain ATCC 700291 / DSM 11019 / CCUG 56400 / KCTC 2939 / LMG 18315 / NBRC 16415 / MH) TaxID=1219045 RepID=A0A086PA01_SPHHM|nr:gamma-glutamylcyclotransferase family protein [Sphingobium herbicidovorans]KFG90219.1 AIG2 family protein [Sphingobium herbicidovorans NBRC 16415]
MTSDLLFVYGTLRPGFGGERAAWLASVARPVDAAMARGALYRVDYYPAFVPQADGLVVGDLFHLPNATAILATLDEYEECAAHFPAPHEYRRERVRVQTTGGGVDAWTYVYARDVAGLERIAGGDFLG